MKALVILAAMLYLSKAHDCDKGRNFWCASYTNSRRCDSLVYCQEHCWQFTGRRDDFLRNFHIRFNQAPDRGFTTLCTESRHFRKSSSFKSAVCDDCKIAVGDLDRFLKDKAAWRSLTAGLRFFCHFLPTYSNLCNEIITDLGTIADLLEPMLSNPERACEEIMMCPKPGGNSSMLSVTTLFQNVYMASPKVRRSNDLCDDCKQACHDIIAQLQDPAQQQNIKETFEELCDYVGPLKNKCIQYIDQFVPQLIQWIISRFTDPAGLCTQLGFCR